MESQDRTIPLRADEIALELPGLRIAVASGVDAGREAALTARSLRVGTAPDNDLVLTDPSVSRHHFELRLHEEQPWVIDAGSTNGTFINGVRVHRALAAHGSRIDVGSTSIHVVASAQPVQIPISKRGAFGGLVGKSLAMRELYALLERAAPTDASVLLHGETGTGKELVAEAIHEASRRADGPFVIVDCGSIPPALFESELFGHKRGSFTGAIADRTGLLVEANGGTIFLDEIGELAPDLQPKLLRALERRQVRPVGATQPVDVDVRVVAASHRNLIEEVNRGAFREDLYYRLAVVRIEVPALRVRRDDIKELVRLFVSRIAPDREDEAASIAASLEHRSFPGNVRELRNAVEEHLILGHSRPGLGAPAARAVGGTGGLPDSVYELAYKDASELAAAEFQREYVHRLLARANGNVSAAAREAGMSRRYLQTLMSRLGLG
ncbi:MAG: sigma 54-interacting transcriptional regulator [Sandaracinaceae bacterium]